VHPFFNIVLLSKYNVFIDTYSLHITDIFVSIKTNNMKLKEQIAGFNQQAVKKLPAELFKLSHQEWEKIAATKITETALRVGDKVPDFTLPDGNGNPVSIAELLKKGNVVISFARGTWCPYCNLEYKAQQDKLPELQSKNTTLISISPELPSNAKDKIAETGITYPILFDKGNEVARKFGIVYTLSDEFKALTKQVFNSDVAIYNGDSSYTLPLPATYIINQQGTIIYAFLNPSWVERAEPEDYISVLN
jgi:peroxiredoxin